MPTDCHGLADLIARLDRSVEAGDAAAITKAVKADLERVLGTGALVLPAQFTVARPEAYARRLLCETPPAATRPSS